MTENTVTVKGVGAYLPGTKIATNEIEEYLGVIPDAGMARYQPIIERFAGIKFRYYALEKHTGRLLEDSTSMAAKAARIAVERAQIDPEDIDLIVVTTSTPPYLRAGLAKEVRLQLGIPGCTTFDLWGACTGLQQAITIATGGIRSGMFRHALLIGVELPSTMGRAENYAHDKITRHDILLRGVLGDGAGALVLGASTRDEDGILYTAAGTEGKDGTAFHREAGGSTLPLNEKTFSEGLHHWHHDFERLKKRGRSYFIDIVKRSLKAADLSLEQIDFIVPAAANFGYFRTEEFLKNATAENRRYVDEIASRIFTNFSNVGNIPSAAIHVSLNELYEQGRLTKDAILLLPSIEGATWGWGATAMKWEAAGKGK